MPAFSQTEQFNMNEHGNYPIYASLAQLDRATALYRVIYWDKSALYWNWWKMMVRICLQRPKQ